MKFKTVPMWPRRMPRKEGAPHRVSFNFMFISSGIMLSAMLSIDALLCILNDKK